MTKKEPISEVIKGRIQEDEGKFFANSNISKYIHDDELVLLVDEVTTKFEDVLQSLIIDTDNDPNSKGTAKRLAKMYVNELMSGRYNPAPEVTAFPNTEDNTFDGMLVVRAELKSVCSHHHQTVSGVAYIGILAADQLPGLSKYSRLAQWCARRGTLQEELCNDIASEIQKATKSNDVAVYLRMEHGCCTNRGIMAHDSSTTTTVLKGAFKSDPSTKKEFFDTLSLQISHKQ
jgi:GTP cyclohydrolase I